MSVKLHTCGAMWLKASMHPCHNVRQAMDDRGVDYELVKEPTYPRGRRSNVIENTGQNMLPAIETADGTWIREESKVLIERINAGEFD